MDTWGLWGLDNSTGTIHEAISAEDLHDYRVERHRQEQELEGLTGGYAADEADYFERGGKPLITLKDYLKGKGGERARYEHERGPVTREVYTPDPDAWGTDEDVPAWARQAFLQRLAAAVRPDMVRHLDMEFGQWVGDNPDRVTEARTPAHRERGPIGNWPNIERFLQDNYPAAHKGLTYGFEQVQPLLDDPHTEWKKPPYETGPEAVKKHGYDPAEVAAGMLLLHNESHPNRGEDIHQEDVQRLHDIARSRSKMQNQYETRHQRRVRPTVGVPADIVASLYRWACNHATH